MQIQEPASQFASQAWRIGLVEANIAVTIGGVSGGD